MRTPYHPPLGPHPCPHAPAPTSRRFPPLKPMPTPHSAVLPECPPLAQSPLSADMQSPTRMAQGAAAAVVTATVAAVAVVRLQLEAPNQLFRRGGMMMC